MTNLPGMTELAAELRGKLFREVSDDVELVLSAETANKGYLSGYHSLSHDVAPQYRSAVLATRDRAALVLSAADAGPAFYLLKDVGALFRYGEFYFETAGDAEPKGYNVPGKASFEEAIAEALKKMQPRSALVGVDRSDGGALWTLCVELLGEGKVVDVTDAFRRARATKTRSEIERIRKATILVEDGIRAIIADARHGMTELDLAAMVTQKMVVGGGVPRFASVTSGPRSALADAYATDRRIERGELIRLDAGCTYDGYWSDMARTFVFGEPSPLQAKTYKALHIGLEEELKAVRAGIAANDLFSVAMDAVRQNGIPHYKRQHCGHGIGLKTYDQPTVNSVDSTMLVKGMCLCVETPYYEINRDGMMVEDTICVTENGYEPITTISRELFILP